MSETITLIIERIKESNKGVNQLLSNFGFLKLRLGNFIISP